MTIKVKVPDMSCNHCKVALDKAIRKIQGVIDVKIDLNTKDIVVEGEVERQKVVKSIEDEGYFVEK